MGPSHLPPLFDDTHDIIKESKLREFFELAPEFATLCGCPGFDHRLPHVDVNAFTHEFAFIQNWVEDVRAVPRDTLTRDQQLDVALFEHLLSLHHYYFHEQDLWRRAPDAISEIGQILFLTLQNGAGDAETLFESIASRLEQVPRYVREHQSRILPPPARWRALAVHTTQAMLPFFEALAQACTLARVSDTLLARVTAGVRGAQTTTESYLQWLRDLACDPRELWVSGPERFAELIRRRKLGFTTTELLEFGTRSLATYETQRLELATRIVGAPDIAKTTALLEAQAPTNFADALAATRDACAQARSFLLAHNIVDLPDNERLDVIETPAFLQPLIPFAAIFPPARFAKQQRSVYMVTPPRDMNNLAKHLNYTSLFNTAVHEGYPGHHLQLSCANRYCSFLRSTMFIGGRSAELVEGWAHYCEELMKDRGFHDTPEGRFAMVNDLVWRATRILIDIQLSCGTMDYNAAVALLMEKTQMSQSAAEGEVNRYTHSPSYQLSYLVGKELIRTLKTDVATHEGAAFSERDFHNRLLRAGSIPVTMIRSEIFGV